MLARHRIPILAFSGLILAVAACGGGEGGSTVERYVEYIRSGQFESAYGMVSEKTREQMPIEQWKSAMHTQSLADVKGVSVRGLRTMSPGGTCLYTDLDFETRNDKGPYGYYIFYLQREAGQLRVQDVLTYDRIEGGMVKTTHFDESREPFACHLKSL